MNRARSPVVREGDLDGLPTLEIAGTDHRVVIAREGATLVSWRVAGLELVDGYRSAAELRAQAGMRSAVMVPFSNRIATQPGALHGLLRGRSYDVTEVTVDGPTARVRFENHDLRPGVFVEYPSAVDVAVTYLVEPSTVAVEIEARNVGDAAATFASGWHPYFRLSDVGIARLVLAVPAVTRVVTGADLIPLEGAAAFAPVDADLDVRGGVTIGDRVLDVCFTDITPSADGLLHATLTDPATGRTLDVWQEHGHVHVYTADHLHRGPRGSIAIEPVEALTDAVDRPDQHGAIALPRGASKTFRFGVAFTSAPSDAVKLQRPNFSDA